MHAQIIANMLGNLQFDGQPIAATAVGDFLSKSARLRRLQEIRDNRYRVATHTQLLTEVADWREASGLVICRPTTSPRLIEQWIGRPRCLGTGADYFEHAVVAQLFDPLTGKYRKDIYTPWHAFDIEEPEQGQLITSHQPNSSRTSHGYSRGGTHSTNDDVLSGLAGFEELDARAALLFARNIRTTVLGPQDEVRGLPEGWKDLREYGRLLAQRCDSPKPLGIASIREILAVAGMDADVEMEVVTMPQGECYALSPRASEYLDSYTFLPMAPRDAVTLARALEGLGVQRETALTTAAEEGIPIPVFRRQTGYTPVYHVLLQDLPQLQEALIKRSVMTQEEAAARGLVPLTELEKATGRKRESLTKLVLRLYGIMPEVHLTRSSIRGVRNTGYYPQHLADIIRYHYQVPHISLQGGQAAVEHLLWRVAKAGHDSSVFLQFLHSTGSITEHFEAARYEVRAPGDTKGWHYTLACQSAVLPDLTAQYERWLGIDPDESLRSAIVAGQHQSDIADKPAAESSRAPKMPVPARRAKPFARTGQKGAVGVTLGYERVDLLATRVRSDPSATASFMARLRLQPEWAEVRKLGGQEILPPALAALFVRWASTENLYAVGDQLNAYQIAEHMNQGFPPEARRYRAEDVWHLAEDLGIPSDVRMTPESPYFLTLYFNEKQARSLRVELAARAARRAGAAISRRQQGPRVSS